MNPRVKCVLGKTGDPLKLFKEKYPIDYLFKWIFKYETVSVL